MSTEQSAEFIEMSEDTYEPDPEWSKEQKKHFYALKQTFRAAFESGEMDAVQPYYTFIEAILTQGESTLDRQVRPTDFTENMKKEEDPEVDVTEVSKKWPTPLPYVTVPPSEAQKEHLSTPKISIEVSSEEESDDEELVYIDCDPNDPEAIPIQELPAYHYGIPEDLEELKSDDEISISSEEGEEEVDPFAGACTNLAQALIERSKSKTEEEQKLADVAVAKTLGRFSLILSRSSKGPNTNEGLHLLNEIVSRKAEMKTEPTEEEEEDEQPSFRSPLNIQPLVPPSPDEEVATIMQPSLHDFEEAGPSSESSKTSEVDYEEEVAPGFKRLRTPDPDVGRDLPAPPLLKRRPYPYKPKRRIPAKTTAEREKRGRVHDYYFNKEWMVYLAQYPGVSSLNRTLFCDQRGIDVSVIEQRERELLKRKAEQDQGTPLKKVR